MNLTHDPSLNRMIEEIPDDVRDAFDTIHRHATTQGWGDKWCYRGYGPLRYHEARIRELESGLLKAAKAFQEIADASRQIKRLIE